ncbi:AMP-binding protein [Parahaliea mediterranea]|uniref:AMP-binding protein n=1 Tax=Parahaliea mediterranea TaxID=651086 RepID=A0A939DHH2_9GAMM|nr:AMP-binding protein [Parahaliea mediterranea]MBN7797602.1 AMP-binding protein [Parahaliea mediterranea]
MNEQQISRMRTALDAFYIREHEQANDTCFTQPFADGSIREYSWAQVADNARRVAAYLVSLDLEPGSRIALMSSNCAYWIMADLAIWLAGHISVPIYPVLTGNSVKQILDHSGAEAMFAGMLDDWDNIRSGVPEHIRIITFPMESSVPRDAGIGWDDILNAYDPISESPRPSLNDLATIIYTSGTTGMPKGVMHTFRNLAIVGTSSGEMYSISSKDRKLSYLPLAHVAERAAVEINQLYYGYQVFFSCSLDSFGDDLRRARPTMFFAVPRIWQKFQQQVLTRIPNQRLQLLLKLPLVSKRIRKKVLSGMGLDNLRVAVSGAAPLSTALIDWYATLGIEILEGYGMSENFAYSHATRAGQSRVGYVGSPLPGVDCKLSEQGEVLIKTPAATIGYYREPELSALLFDEDGYIRTGDKGEIDEMGRLRITGRLKEIFKTSKGKYVAPAPIEDRLLRNQAIEQVCVTGANFPQPIALITLGEQSQVSSRTPEDKNRITQGLEKTLRSVNATLDKHEKIARMVIVADQWTIDNGLMTPTLKVKRTILEEAYAARFPQWLRQPEPVLWATPVL